MTSGWTRREFLAAANAAALLTLLEGCSLGPFGRAASSPSPLAGGSRRAQALNALRQAVRESPDHLVSRAADAAAGKDIAKIVDFVRTRLAVLPGSYEGADPVTNRRYGPAAALRSGQGTLRERADLLADLLTRAGFKAQVQQARLPAGVTLSDLYKQRSEAFAPDMSLVNRAKSLLHDAGFPDPAPPHPFDAGKDPVNAMLAVLPSGRQNGRVRGDLLPAHVPVVAIDDGGKKRYAFAIGSVGSTDSAPDGLANAPAADATPNVTLTVSALSNPAPGSTTARGTLIDLVTGTWPLEVLAGHQVLIMFPPLQGPKAVLDSGLGSLPVREPVMRVQTDVTPAAGPSSLVAFSRAVTVHGDVLASTADSLTGPYGAITLLSDADRAAAIGKVASIKASVNATAYPDVALDVVLADAGGAPVNGLDASAFAVKEQGQPVGSLVVYSNQATQAKPRVLVVYDAQSPSFWPSAAAKSAFDSGFARALADLAAKTPFDVQVIGLGATPAPAGWAAPQAAALTTTFTTGGEAADDPWRTVGGAALEQGVAAMVLVSDCQTTDVDAAQVPTLQRRLATSRVPVYVVPVGQPEEQTVQALAAASGGSRIPNDASAPAKLAALLAPAVKGWIGGAYRLRYTAPTGGPARRDVTVGLTGRAQPVGSASYTVPSKPLPPPSFVGLYLRIDVQGAATSFRRLAGAEFALRGGAQGVVDDPAVVAEVRAALDGVTTVAFEPGTPTTAALLDDLIGSALSAEPLWPIWGDATNDQLVAAAAKGFTRMPIALGSMLRPEAIDQSAPVALRVAILQERVVGGNAEQHLDLAIGVNQFVPLTADRHAAFKAVMSSSIGSSQAEAATFTDSAYGRLQDQQLVPLVSGDAATPATFLQAVPASRLQAWKAMLRVYQDYHLAVPLNGGADALWVINPDTGEAKAVLLDGTGGALIRTKCSYDSFDQLAITLAFLSILCTGPAASYGFFCVGINTAAAAMAAASVFNKHWDPGTPVSIALAVYNPLEAMAGVNLGVGVMLLLITLQSGCGK